jgi:hypothetical protein
MAVGGQGMRPDDGVLNPLVAKSFQHLDKMLIQ